MSLRQLKFKPKLKAPPPRGKNEVDKETEKPHGTLPEDLNKKPVSSEPVIKEISALPLCIESAALPVEEKLLSLSEDGNAALSSPSARKVRDADLSSEQHPSLSKSIQSSFEEGGDHKDLQKPQDKAPETLPYNSNDDTSGSKKSGSISPKAINKSLPGENKEQPIAKSCSILPYCGGGKKSGSISPEAIINESLPEESKEQSTAKSCNILRYSGGSKKSGSISPEPIINESLPEENTEQSTAKSCSILPYSGGSKKSGSISLEPIINESLPEKNKEESIAKSCNILPNSDGRKESGSISPETIINESLPEGNQKQSIAKSCNVLPYCGGGKKSGSISPDAIINENLSEENKKQSIAKSCNILPNSDAGKPSLPSLRQHKCKPKLIPSLKRPTSKPCSELVENSNESEVVENSKGHNDDHKPSGSDENSCNDSLDTSVNVTSSCQPEEQSSESKELNNSLERVKTDDKFNLPSLGKHKLPIRQLNSAPKIRLRPSPLSKKPQFIRENILSEQAVEKEQLPCLVSSPSKNESTDFPTRKRPCLPALLPLPEVKRKKPKVSFNCKTKQVNSSDKKVHFEKPNVREDSRKRKSAAPENSCVPPSKNKLPPDGCDVEERDEVDNRAEEIREHNSENTAKSNKKISSQFDVSKKRSRALYGSKSIRSYLSSCVRRPKLTNRSKRPFAPSTYGKMCFEAKQEFEKKFGENEPDASKMTMLELIFCNRKDDSMHKPKNRTRRESCATDITETSPSDKNSADKETDDYLPDEKDPLALDEPDPIPQREEATENSGDVPVPQLKLTADGRIVIAEETLVIEQSKGTLSEDIEEFTWVRQKKKKADAGMRSGWSHEETLKFYKILNAVGSDFETIRSFFPNRSRKNIKSKFKREEKIHGKLIDKVMSKPSEYIVKETCEELEDERLYDGAIESNGRNLQIPKNRMDSRDRHSLLFGSLKKKNQEMDSPQEQDKDPLDPASSFDKSESCINEVNKLGQGTDEFESNNADTQLPASQDDGPQDSRKQTDLNLPKEKSVTHKSDKGSKSTIPNPSPNYKKQLENGIENSNKKTISKTITKKKNLSMEPKSINIVQDCENSSRKCLDLNILKRKKAVKIPDKRFKTTTLKEAQNQSSKRKNILGVIDERRVSTRPTKFKESMSLDFDEEAPQPEETATNIVISTDIKYDHVRLTQYITYNSNNLDYPIEVNATIAHDSEPIDPEKTLSELSINIENEIRLDGPITCENYPIKSVKSLPEHNSERTSINTAQEHKVYPENSVNVNE